jgi:predicted NBD/HSP70 family sugar kinase
VLYATNLGWPDNADPAHELGLESVSILENDARAAGLGESILRSGDRPTLDLLYINLGTGVGDAQVIRGVASHFDIVHHHVGGTRYCTGCRGVGCVNSYLCSASLPKMLTEEDCGFVARTLASALRDKSIDGRMLLVLGGGIVRRYPAIVAILNDLIPNPTELTAAPAEAKSAAFLRLGYLARSMIVT